MKKGFYWGSIQVPLQQQQLQWQQLQTSEMYFLVMGQISKLEQWAINFNLIRDYIHPEGVSFWEMFFGGNSFFMFYL